MNLHSHQKITAEHLKRGAYLYIRQSTLRQVMENTESTHRQYALRERAVALGWPLERVLTIDCDLGQSGADSDREGFQKLVTDVGLGRAGIVVGLEVSRLARSCVDWHRLLEICALTHTLIMDEDGIYDPSHFNDRLLLGLKGTMSEAELHVLRARLRGGILNKARRGELKRPLPIGYRYAPNDRVAMDPDQQVQQAVQVLFQTFRRTGSAHCTVKEFREKGLLFPRHARPHHDEVVWGQLQHSRVLQILHNPWYAGAYVFGRTRTRRTTGGKTHTTDMPRDQWHSLIRDAHPSYITWDEHEENVRRLHDNAQAYGLERRKSPPREGPALLQGLAVCGLCGARMTVRYHVRGGKLTPDYVCQSKSIEKGDKKCQEIPGASLDEAIGGLLIETMTPLALEVALTVQDELESRMVEIDRLRQQQVERCRYEAELARRRYMRVDPDNRLVADALEAEWNQKLRSLTAAQDEYENLSKAEQKLISDQQRAELQALATDFPRLWRDPRTPDRDRKRMVRLMLEDITLLKGTKRVTAQVRFRGGATRAMDVAFLPGGGEQIKTDPRAVAEIDRLLDDHTYEEIAKVLTEQGFKPGRGAAFTSRLVYLIGRAYSLRSRFKRLRDRGLLTVDEVAERLQVTVATVSKWRRWGLLTAYRSHKRAYLYEPPSANMPAKFARKGPKVEKHSSSSRRSAV